MSDDNMATSRPHEILPVKSWLSGDRVMAVGRGALPVLHRVTDLFPQAKVAVFASLLGGGVHETLLVPGLGGPDLAVVLPPMSGRPAIHSPTRNRPWALVRVGETEAGSIPRPHDPGGLPHLPCANASKAWSAPKEPPRGVGMGGRSCPFSRPSCHVGQ